MAPEIFRPVDLDTHVVERLDAATVRSVAARLGASTTFEALVARESEMDALFTLCDLALTTDRGGTAADARDRLARVRTLVTEAHDCTHTGANDRAAALLEGAAQLLEGGDGP